ncbi:MAG: YcxB family protein [Bacteroidota bacterium]
MDQITTEIQYTPEELQHSYQVHYRKMHPFRSRILMLLGILSFMLGVGFMIYTYVRASETNWFAWFLIVYGIVVIIYYYYMYVTMGKRMFRKMPDFHTPFKYTFTPEGMSVRGKNISTDSRWAHFQSYYFTDDLIVIYPNKYRFNFFPKSHFTAEEYDQLKQWIEAASAKK